MPTFPKVIGPRAKVARVLKSKARKLQERLAQQAVRRRDKSCRFPLCGCRTFGLRLEVSHSRHRGMGGNPAGDRSTTALMVLLCGARHKDNRIALDKGTLRWIPLKPDLGADGPIAWALSGGSLFMPEIHTGLLRSEWYELARETRPGGIWEPFTIEQLAVLKRLAKMIE